MNYVYYPIETTQMMIRHVQESDFVALAMLHNNRFLSTYFTHVLELYEDFDAYYESFYENSYLVDANALKFALILKQDLRLVGTLNVHKEEGMYRLDIVILPSLWDNGLAYEAGISIIDALKKAELPYLTAVIDSDNFAATQLLNKLGFTYRYSYQRIVNNQNKALRMYQLDLQNCDGFVFKGYLTMALYHRSFIENLDE